MFIEVLEGPIATGNNMLESCPKVILWQGGKVPKELTLFVRHRSSCTSKLMHLAIATTTSTGDIPTAEQGLGLCSFFHGNNLCVQLNYAQAL